MSFLGWTLRMDARPSRTMQQRQDHSHKADTSVDMDSPLKPPQTELIFAGLGNIFDCNRHAFWFVCGFFFFFFGLCCLLPTLLDPMECNPLVSSVQGISQARILEWVSFIYSFIHLFRLCGLSSSCGEWGLLSS